MASPRLAISRFAAQARFLSSRWFDLIPLSSDPVRGVVPAQLVLQDAEIRPLPDADELDAENAGEVLELRRVSGLAEGGVVCAAGEDPAGAAALEVGAGDPDRARGGELRHRLAPHGGHLRHDHPPAPPPLGPPERYSRARGRVAPGPARRRP